MRRDKKEAEGRILRFFSYYGQSHSILGSDKSFYEKGSIRYVPTLL